MGGLVAVQGKVALLALLVPHDERIVDGNSPRAAGEAELLCQCGKQTLAATWYFVVGGGKGARSGGEDERVLAALSAPSGRMGTIT